MNRETEILCTIHEGLPRQGPGRNECTEKAFRMIPAVSPDALILDIGCGSGMQTLELARLSGGRIIALDIHEPFLRDLERESKNAGLQCRVESVRGSMFDLPFKAGKFDIVWSEGAMYIMGLENGLISLRGLLKTGGYMALTELTWLKDNPPQDLAAFWRKVYPAMKNMDQNLATIEGHGYREMGHFVLPQEAWWEGYYGPLKDRLEAIAKKYENDREAVVLFEEMRLEIDLYRRYSEYYGYVFYVIQDMTDEG